MKRKLNTKKLYFDHSEHGGKAIYVMANVGTQDSPIHVLVDIETGSTYTTPTKKKCDAFENDVGDFSPITKIKLKFQL